MATRESKAQVRVDEITEGVPALLSFSEIITRPDSRRKLISQSVQITDAGLLARLRQEVHHGDEAEVVLESRLSSVELTTTLKDFSLLNSDSPAA